MTHDGAFIREKYKTINKFWVVLCGMPLLFALLPLAAGPFQRNDRFHIMQMLIIFMIFVFFVIGQSARLILPRIGKSYASAVDFYTRAVVFGLALTGAAAMMGVVLFFRGAAAPTLWIIQGIALLGMFAVRPRLKELTNLLGRFNPDSK